MKLLKRISILALCLALLCSMTLSASAATTQSAKAATLRLEKTQGTVTVQNGSGTAKKATQNMKLLSGYTVSTGKASYAFISLDDSKAIKLDASSKVTVQKAGKKLEVKLISGKVMFNVSAPLTSQESLTIRTSTMVTGVRGTAGWFETDGNYLSAVYLLEGSLTIQTLGSGSNSGTTSLSPCQRLIASIDRASGSNQPTTPTNFTSNDVPGFVAKEVAENPDLQKRMAENGSPIDPAAVANGADEKLKQDEAAADKKDQQIQQQEQQSTSDAQQNQNSNDTLFDNNSSEPEYVPTPEIGTGSGGSDSGSDGSGSGSGGSDSGSDDSGSGGSDSGSDGSGSDSEPEPVVNSIELTDPVTQAELQTALNDYDVVNLYLTKTVITDQMGNEIEIPEDGGDTGYEGDLMTVTTNGIFGGLIIPENKQLVLKQGTMGIVCPNYDELSEPCSEPDLDIRGTLCVDSGATLLNVDAKISIFPTGTLEINGTYTDSIMEYGKLENAGNFIVNGNANITHEILNTPALEIDGEMQVDPDCLLKIGVDGSLVLSESYLANDGTLLNEGTLILCYTTLYNGNGSQFTNGTNATLHVGIRQEGEAISLAGSGDMYFSAVPDDSNPTPAMNYGTIVIYGDNQIQSTVTISSDCVLENNQTGCIIVDGAGYGGRLTIVGELINGGKLINNDAEICNNGSLYSTGTIENTGTFITKSIGDGSGTVIAGTLNNHPTNYDTKSIIILEGGIMSLTNKAILHNDGEVAVEGELIITSDCMLNNYGTLYNSGTIQNDGTVANNAAVKEVPSEDGSTTTIQVFGTINNYNTFNNYGRLLCNSTTVDGKSLSTEFFNKGTLYNSVGTAGTGSIIIDGGILQNGETSTFINETIAEKRPTVTVGSETAGGELHFYGQVTDDNPNPAINSGDITVGKNGILVIPEGYHLLNSKNEINGTITIYDPKGEGNIKVNGDVYPLPE